MQSDKSHRCEDVEASEAVRENRARRDEVEVTSAESASRPGSTGVLLGIQADQAFARPHGIGETRKLAANIMAGGGVNAVKIVLQLMMLPLMAHLLGPAEYGIYGLALPTVAIFMSLADGGLGASLAREPTLSQEIWSTAFWLLLMVGVGLGLTTVIWGLVLASLSHEPRVASVMGVLSISFLLVTLSVLPGAQLTRQRRIATISFADLMGNIIGAAVAVALAYSGAGAMSLAAQYVTIFLVRAIVLNRIVFVRPSFIFKISAIRSHLSTGTSLVCSRLIDFAGRLIENLVYGRMFGTVALGSFTFANQMPRFVCEAASSPLWGALYAHCLRADDREIRQLHAKLVHILALVLAPVAFLTSAAIAGVIHLVLGPAWEDASTLISILIPFAALSALATQSLAVLLAKGRGWVMFGLSLFLVGARVAAVLAGYWLGPVGVAWGLAAAQMLYAILTLFVLQRLSMTTAIALLRGVWAPTLAGLVSGMVCYVVLSPSPLSVFFVASGVMAGGCAYLVVLFLLQGKDLIDNVRSVVKLARP